MSRMVIAVLMGTLQMNACELTSTSTGYKVTISREVADFGIGLGHNGMVTLCDLTERDLKHTAKYLLFQYRLHKKNNHILSDDTDPEKKWDTYVYGKVNGRELSVLTRTAFAYFPNQQPIPHGLIKPWTTAIKENQYELGHLLGLFPSEKTYESLGQRIWDAYATEQKLPLAQELIDSSVVPETSDEALFSRSWKNIWGIDGLEPVYRTQEQLTQGSKKGEVSTISERETQNTPSNVIDLDPDKDNTDKAEDKKPSLNRFDSIKRAISERWSHMSSFKKIAVSGGFSAFALFCLYLTYRR